MKYTLIDLLHSKSSGYLLKLFACLSVISLIVILLVVNFGIRQVYIKQSIKEAENNAITISKVIFENEKNILLSPNSEGNKTLKVSPELFSDLDYNMSHYLVPLNILKIKFFSKDKKVIYSTDRSIIGLTDNNNMSLEKALGGEVVSKLEIKEEVWDLAGEKRVDRDIVETYIPIRDENNEILGSFEIYLDISKHREDVNNALQLSIVVFAVTLFSIFGILFLVMRVSAYQLDKKEVQLKHQTLYDKLTNLPNRENFLLHLKRIVKRYKFKNEYLFAVLSMDLDRFKNINNSLGHTIGDKLLVEVALRLENSVRPTDSISRAAETQKVARFGGDEFAVLLNDIRNITSTLRITDRIQTALQQPFYIDGHELFISVSIGIALSATDYDNAENILRDADTAMFRAKDKGGARAEIFDNDMHISVQKTMQLESDLRTALDNDQLMVYYQPIVSAKSGRITGAEALLRWNHPERGLISPDEFIPIAEDSGLIIEIGKWVFKTACAQNKEWHDKGYDNLLMKVNVSSKQLFDRKFIEMVKDVIRKTNISAHFIDIEITESLAMEKSFSSILTQLAVLGTQITIDDFGTGYSSISYLIEFPINTIKLDRSFIDNIEFSDTAMSIVKSIIAMAHSINIELVAEGVETEDQLRFLQSHKCDKIQGYFFSPPVPAMEFTALLEQHRNGFSFFINNSPNPS